MGGSGADLWDGSGRDGGDECDCEDCGEHPTRSTWWDAKSARFERDLQEAMAAWPLNLLMDRAIEGFQ